MSKNIMSVIYINKLNSRGSAGVSDSLHPDDIRFPQQRLRGIEF
jgi:hypothetical protein